MDMRTVSTTPKAEKASCKKSLMTIWESLDKDLDSNKNIAKTNLALMAQAFSDEESNSKSDSESYSDSNNENEVFYDLSKYELIYLTQSLVNNCQIKSRKILILKNQHDKVCNVLKTLNEKAHLALNEQVSNKVLNDQEVAPKEFISDMLNKSKMAFMVYNIKMNKRRVLITQRRIPLLEKLKCFSGHQYLVSSQPEVRPIPTCTYINQYNDYVSKIFHFKIKIA
jgi:hypothetical protein